MSSSGERLVLERPEPSNIESLKAVAITNFYFNIVLIIFVPLGIMAGALKWNDSAVFLINMIGIITLAKMLDLSTDQLSIKVGQALGALINASFGNAVELIVGVIALKEGLLTVVQSSLIGSVLSNLLLVLGFCFFLGGLKHKTQVFNAKASNIEASLFVLSLFGFMLPTVFTHQGKDEPKSHVMLLSRGTAIMLIITYVAFLWFQFTTHKHFFEGEQEEEEEELLVNPPVAIATVIISTVLIGISAEYLVGSLEGISKQWGINETFIGMILLPVVGNAAEHVTAIFAALRNKMDLAIGVSLLDANINVCYTTANHHWLDHWERPKLGFSNSRRSGALYFNTGSESHLGGWGI